MPLPPRRAAGELLPGREFLELVRIDRPDLSGTVMGNLHHQSMEEIWAGEPYRALRAGINSPTPPAPCSICPMFRRTGNRGSLLQHSARAAAESVAYSTHR